MKAKQRVPAPRAERLGILPVNGSAAIEFRCSAHRRDRKSQAPDWESRECQLTSQIGLSHCIVILV